MFPWLWLWSPRFELPLSGNISQDISPEWFFKAINPEAGDGEVEKKIFDSASYGKQLGLITEVLLSLVDGGVVESAQAKKSLETLKSVYTDIESIKRQHTSDCADTAIELLKNIKAANTAEFDRVLESLALKR